MTNGSTYTKDEVAAVKIFRGLAGATSHLDIVKPAPSIMVLKLNDELSAVSFKIDGEIKVRMIRLPTGRLLELIKLIKASE